MKKLIPLLVLLSIFMCIPVFGASTKDIGSLSCHFTMLKKENDDWVPVNDYNPFYFISKSKKEKCFYFMFMTIINIGCTNYEDLIVTKPLSVIHKRSAQVEINGVRTAIKNEISDSDFPVTFLKTTTKIYRTRVRSHWFVKIEQEALRENSYKPFDLVIISKIFNADDTEEISSTEFKIKLIPDRDTIDDKSPDTGI